MVLIVSNFWRKCLKRALETNVQKRSPFFLEHPVVVISLLHQQTETKRNPLVVLYTHIVQVMTHKTIAYKAAAYLAIMLLSLLAYYRGLLGVKGCMYQKKA